MNIHIQQIINNNESFFLNSIIKNIITLKCFSVGFSLKIINRTLVKNCKEKNLKVAVYSDKNIEYKTALDLWNIGVDSIFVDNPIYYKKVLE